MYAADAAAGARVVEAAADSGEHVWVTAVLRELRGGRMAAPGPSGLRLEHVREALSVKAVHDRLARALAHAVDSVCAGRAHQAYRDGRLFPLPKKAGGIRPIGAGELLRRVAARVVLRAAGPRLTAYCEERGQYGASQDGALRARTAARAAWAAGNYLVAIDVHNAFNSIDREAVQGLFPDGAVGYEFVRSMYSADGPTIERLHAGDGWAVPSTRGVIQGCPLAATLFAAALATVIADVRGRVGATVLSPPAPGPDAAAGPRPAAGDVWFADDGHVAGNPAQLAEYLVEAEDALGRVGLRLNRAKTYYLAPTHGDTGAALLPLPAALLERAVAAPGGVLSGLGAPIGPAEACRAAAARRLASIRATLHSISLLEEPLHVVQALSLAGGWSRAEYHVSAAAPDELPEGFAEDVEAADALALCCALGSHARFFHSLAWVQATLPRRLGGLGIRSATRESRICRAAAAARLRARAEGPRVLSAHMRDTRQAREDADTLFLTNSVLPCCDVWDRARLAELRADRGAPLRWLALPLRASLLPDAAACAAALALVLGVEVVPATTDARCPRLCTSNGSPKPLDGIHLLGCRRTWTPRHHLARDTLARSLTALTRLRVVSEAAVAANGDPVPPGAARGVCSLRPVDVGFSAPGSARWLTFDIRCSSYEDADVVGALAAGDSLAAAEQAYVAKARAGAASSAVRRLRAARHEWVPLGFGPLGSLARRSCAALRRAARMADAAADYGTPLGEPDRISVVLGLASLAVLTGAARVVTDARVDALLVSWGRSPALDGAALAALPDPAAGWASRQPPADAAEAALLDHAARPLDVGALLARALGLPPPARAVPAGA